MQGIRNAMEKVGLRSHSSNTATGTGTSASGGRYEYTAKVRLQNLMIERLPEHLARGRLEPYLAISRNDEKTSTHRTWTKKDWSLTSGLISYNETYDIECSGNDVLKVVLFNDAPLLRPDQAVGEAVIPVRDFVTGQGGLGSTGTTMAGGSTEGSLLSDRTLRLPINEVLTDKHSSSKAGSVGTTGVSAPLGFLNLTIQMFRIGTMGASSAGGLTSQTGSGVTSGSTAGGVAAGGVAAGALAAGGPAFVTPGMRADPYDEERNLTGIAPRNTMEGGGKQVIDIFVDNLFLDQVALERLLGWKKQDMDSKLHPYIYVHTGLEGSRQIKSNIFRNEGSTGRFFMRDKITVYCNPTDQLYLYLVDGNFLGHDNYLGYCILPAQEIFSGRRFSSNVELPLQACDPKNNKKAGIPSVGGAGFGTIGMISLRCLENTAGIAQNPSLTAIAGTQSNLGAVPLTASTGSGVGSKTVQSQSMQSSTFQSSKPVTSDVSTTSQIAGAEPAVTKIQQSSTFTQQTVQPVGQTKIFESGQVYSEPQLGSGTSSSLQQGLGTTGTTGTYRQ